MGGVAWGHWEAGTRSLSLSPALTIQSASCVSLLMRYCLTPKNAFKHNKHRGTVPVKVDEQQEKENYELRYLGLLSRKSKRSLETKEMKSAHRPGNRRRPTAGGRGTAPQPLCESTRPFLSSALRLKMSSSF